MRKLILLFSALVLSANVLFGEVIKGTVLDDTGEPAIAATIQVKGAPQVGTITDIDGNFSINMPEGKNTLIVSYVGYATVEAVAKNGMTVHLQQDAEMLDEVIAVGYSTTTRKAYAGSASVVNAETIEKKSPTELSKALAGEVAGVQVVNTTGQPGSQATIQIRGVGSINSSTTPLYVVDGIPYDGDVSAIDPADIASTTVLKDATATSLYGSRGSNGVILITTKKGTAGEQGRIEVDVKYGGNMRLIPLYRTIQDPQRYVELAWEGLKNEAGGNTLTASNKLFGLGGLPAAYNRWDADPTTLIDQQTGMFFPDITLKEGYIKDPEPSWQKAIFRNGQKIDANLKISGGSDKTTYYTSFGFLKDEGYYVGSDYQRINGRVNVGHQAKKWLKGGINLAYAYSTYNSAGQGNNMNNGLAFVNECPPIYSVFARDANGYRLDDPKIAGKKMYDYGDTSERLYAYGINPAGSLLYDRNYTRSHQVTGNAYLEATLYEGLKVTANFGLQYLGQSYANLTNSYYGDAANVGRILRSSTEMLSFTFNQIISYNMPSNGDHNFDAFIAHETGYNMQSVMSGYKNYTQRPDGLELGNALQMVSITSASGKVTLESYFAQARYNYKERYFFHGTIRADGSSRFAKDHRWGCFGSIGLSWAISNEDFMADVPVLKNMKLRASWGALGNQEISTFLYTNQYTMSNVNNTPGYSLTHVGNEELTWEKSTVWNVGIDFDLSKYLTASVEYFYKSTKDMLFPRTVAPSLGYSTYYVNDGAISNQGVEFQLNVHAVNKSNIKLDIRLNGGYYSNKTTQMPKDNNGETMIMNGGMALGHSIYDFYTIEWEGVNTETGKAQYRAYFDKAKGVTEETFDQVEHNISSVYNYIYSTYKDNGCDYNGKHYTVEQLLKNPELILGHTIVENSDYASATYVGKSASPKLAGGLGIDLDAYGFNFSAAFQYSLGGYGMDYAYMQLMHSDRAGEMNWHQDIENRWQKPGDKTDVPRLSNGEDLYANSPSTRFLISSSYLTLSNVRLGYTFPKKWMNKIKMNSLSVWVQGDNLFCLSARRGYVPMASLAGSSSTYQYIPLSTIVGGIKFSF